MTKGPGGRRRSAALAASLLLAMTAGCGDGAPATAPPETSPSVISGQGEPETADGAQPLATLPGSPGTTVPAPTRPAAAPATTPAAPVPPPPAAPTVPTAPPGTVVEVAYRLERRTTDAATAGFEAFALATLSDARGWGRAGFRLVHRPDAPFVVVLAEGPEVDALCLPYDTYGQYSCQNGPTVALNADRWRTATPKWTGSLDDYRRYLVGHEVGHLLGLRHPRTQCPAPGRPAPLMAQQSTELDGCLPNPWPLEGEVQLARRRPADLAPPFRR